MLYFFLLKCWYLFYFQNTVNPVNGIYMGPIIPSQSHIKEGNELKILGRGMSPNTKSLTCQSVTSRIHGQILMRVFFFKGTWSRWFNRNHEDLFRRVMIISSFLTWRKRGDNLILFYFIIIYIMLIYFWRRIAYSVVMLINKYHLRHTYYQEYCCIVRVT